MRHPIKVVDLGSRAARVVNDDEPMKCYTVYDHPKDYPDHFVVRAWLIHPDNPEPQPTEECFLATSLEEARTFVPEGLISIPRSPGDDEPIVETWM